MQLSEGKLSLKRRQVWRLGGYHGTMLQSQETVQVWQVQRASAGDFGRRVSAAADLSLGVSTFPVVLHH